MEEDNVPDWMLSGVDHEVKADVESTTKKTNKEKAKRPKKSAPHDRLTKLLQQDNKGKHAMFIQV